MYKKKLIEVALPLEKINAESAREKSIRHGHPASLHLWWARRPLTTARAVIWASLVDDPSSHPELFPTEEEQNAERQRLFEILEQLVIWENSNNPDVLRAAKAEIMKSTDNNPPALLDPFAGGGAIPLEAQRLGLEAHAHDLNPVSVMINKALLDFPQRFHGLAPINPDNSQSQLFDWSQTSGLSEDVFFYGNKLRHDAYEQLKNIYPTVSIDGLCDGNNVIAWIWARTVKCPNPACNCIIPLVKCFDLSRNRGGRGKSGKFASIDFKYHGTEPEFFVIPSKTKINPTISRTGGICPNCNEAFDLPYVRKEACSGRMGAKLMAVIAEGISGRVYLSPDDIQKEAANIQKPQSFPSGVLTGKARVSVPLYGMEETSDLFTNRQLVTLSTLSNMIPTLQEEIESQAVTMGMADDKISINNGGKGARAYSEAIATYLSFVIDQQANHLSSLCGWHINNEQLMNTFGRQAIPMVWDFAECNPFSNSTGSFNNLLDRVVKGIKHLTYKGKMPEVSQYNAQSDCGLRNILISTDPPYYDNICYADLSDFFYVWMRNSIKPFFPDVFKTMLVPKEEELIASPFRFERKEESKSFFENGMVNVCKQLYKYSSNDYPITIYYAFKENDTNLDDTKHSSGWETMLSSIINSGLTINGTWPMRTEQTAALKSKMNYLASSIVLVCRKRDENAPVCIRRNFVNELKRELKTALKNLQSSNIAPVDMAQSAIGPGIAVFSKYKAVLEADGTPMSVRAALQIINQELDLYFNEQDNDLDSESRFCVELYSQYAFNDVKFGDANTLATAKNISVKAIADHGIVYAQKGIVRLTERNELPEKVNVREASVWHICQYLTFVMEKKGIDGCAEMLSRTISTKITAAKELAYRLYTIAERKKWTQEAYAYNSLIQSWKEIQEKAAKLSSSDSGEQLTL